MIENTTKGDEHGNDVLRETIADRPSCLRAHIAKLEAALATVTAERDAGRVEADGMTDDAYRLGLPLMRFYDLIMEYIRTEGGIPMTDALGACIDAVEASRLSPPSVPGGV